MANLTNQTNKEEVTTPVINRDRPWVEVGLDHTMNTGNFENIKIHLVYGRPLETGENPGEAMHAILQAVGAELVAGVDEIKEDLKANKDNG